MLWRRKVTLEMVAGWTKGSAVVGDDAVVHKTWEERTEKVCVTECC